MKRSWVLAALVVVGTVVAIFISPGPGRELVRTNEFELLEDASFSVTGLSSPWRGPFTSVSANDLAGGVATRIENAAVTQNVDFGATNRSYRFTVRMRADGTKGSNARGFLRMQTRCDLPETTTTAFSVTDTWQDVSATLDPANNARCSLGVGLEATGGAAVLIQYASLVDANLLNASFEVEQSPPPGSSNPGWKLVNDSEPSRFALIADKTARDGRAVGWLRGQRPSGSVAQDVELDPSSEQVRATANVALRAAPGAPAGSTATLALWTICDKPENAVQRITLDDTWQNASVTLTPKQRLRRVDKPPCTIRVEIYNDVAGAGVYLDAAHLTLETAELEDDGSSPTSP